MRSDCGKDASEEFLKAIEQFNREEYYECHETLEDLWRAEKGRIRDFYKGILQIGVGIYHAGRFNSKGALRLISSGMELTRQFAPVCHGIDVDSFLQASDRIKKEIETMTREQSLSFDLIPKIRRRA